MAMHIPEQPDSIVANRTCPACHKGLVRRPNENEACWAIRTFCDKACYLQARKRSARRGNLVRNRGRDSAG